MTAFIDFARAHGLVLDHVIEGRWVRTPTATHQRKRNGAYKYLGDVGFVQDHGTMADVAVWHPERNQPVRIDRAKLREQQRRQAAELAVRHAFARRQAKEMLEQAVEDVHPYLAAKGFPKETGFVRNEELLIPMRDVHNYQKLNGVQRISKTGEKLFLSGAKAKDSVFLMGPFKAREIYLCEGFVTALSLKAALNELRRAAKVCVCFSAGNMVSVAAWAKAQALPAFICADHDASNTGERSAVATGLPWVMPPDVGMDANDLHQRSGLRALVKLLLDVGR